MTCVGAIKIGGRHLKSYRTVISRPLIGRPARNAEGIKCFGEIGWDAIGVEQLIRIAAPANQTQPFNPGLNDLRGAQIFPGVANDDSSAGNRSKNAGKSDAAITAATITSAMVNAAVP